MGEATPMRTLDAFTTYLAEAHTRSSVGVAVCDDLQTIGDAAAALSGDGASVLTCGGDAAARLRTANAFGHSLLQVGLEPAFVGDAPRSEDKANAFLAVVDPAGQSPAGTAPAAFRVVAVVPTYNEEDLIEQTLRYLIGE